MYFASIVVRTYFDGIKAKQDISEICDYEVFTFS